MTSARQSGSVDSPSFGELSPAECATLLQDENIGRLAFSLHDRVNVLPVHYRYSGGWIYGRTAPGGKLLQILRNRWVAFEVDRHEGLFDWRSVVVHGALYLIEPERSAQERAVYDRAVEILRAIVPATLDIGDPVPFRNQLFRIHAAELTGRFSRSDGGNGISVTPVEQPPDTADSTADTILRGQVIAATAPFVRGDKSSMHVEVYDGVVVLGGTVEDPRARASIEASVVQLPGVHALVQQLETAGLRTSELGPAETAMKALRALRASPLPAGSDVTVVVDHGWLRLEGSVPSSAAREEVRRRVENIPGARGFVDRITIAPDEIPAAVPPGPPPAYATATRKEEQNASH